MSKKTNRVNDNVLIAGALVLLLLLAFAFYKGSGSTDENQAVPTADTTQVDTPKTEIDTALIND